MLCVHSVEEFNARYNVFNMPLAFIQTSERRIDRFTSITTAWAIDYDTGEILAQESEEHGLFGVEAKEWLMRTVSVGARMRGRKVVKVV